MRRLDDERGAVAVLVAILMVALLGFAAIGVDVANMASDKQQLQNGADAGALAVAQSCAVDDTVNCTISAGSTVAASMADSNRLDGAGNATVSGSVTSLTADSVTVQTTGATNHWFAPILGMDASTITSTATATWKSPGGSTGLPVTISKCELLAQGFTFDSQGHPVIPNVSYMRFFMTGSGDEDNNLCALSGASGSIPGGFGYLDAVLNTATGGCYATTVAGTVTPEFGSDPGNGPDNTCTNAYYKSLLGQRIVIPVFDAVYGTGANATYRVYGYATFVLYGYLLNPGQFAELWAGAPSELTAQNICDGGNGNSGRCIVGEFVEWSTVDNSANSVGNGTPNLGTTIVFLSR